MSLTLRATTTFNNSGSYEIEGSDPVISSDSTGIFINTGTLAKTVANFQPLAPRLQATSRFKT